MVIDPQKLFRFTDETRRARLINLRAAVEPILANNLQPDYTDHSCDHSDNVVLLVNSLSNPLHGTKHALTDRELSVLYAACYTHDIGMQDENVGDMPAIRDRFGTANWDRMTRPERADILRDLHPILSAQLVSASVRNVQPPIGISLTEEDDPASVAALCEAHGLWLEQIAQRHRYELLVGPGGPPLRMGLLSSLLRIADILEETRRRAKPQKSRSLIKPLLSQVHWWRHYYTSDTVIADATRTITLVFDFPPARRQEYERLVPQLQLPMIQTELRLHEGTLSPYGLDWYVTSRVDTSPYGIAEDMPGEVALEMVALLKERTDREAAEHRRAALGVYELAAPTTRRLTDELDALPPDTLPTVRAEQMVRLADHMRRIGARRGEMSFLDGAYELCSQAGGASQQLEIGLRLLPLMLAEGRESSAIRMLTSVKQAADAAHASRPQLTCLAALAAKAYDTQGLYKQGEDAFLEAIALALADGNDALAAELTADLGEAQMLFGSLVDAERTVATLAATESSNTQARARAAAVMAHVAARRGNVDQSLAFISVLTDQSDALKTGVRRSLDEIRARVLFLAGKDRGASAILVSLLEAMALNEDADTWLALDANRILCDLRSARTPNELRDAARSNDRIADELRIAGLPSNAGAHTLLRGLEHRQEGEHSEALPMFWQELRRAYKHGEWRRLHKAHSNLALECIDLGWLNAAAFHAVESLSVSVGERVARTVVGRRDRDLITDILPAVMHSMLPSHFLVASKIIEMLADYIPSDCVQGVLKYLLRYATVPEPRSLVPSCAAAAWKALEPVSALLTGEAAVEFLDHISTLDLAGIDPFGVERVLQALRAVLPGLPSAELPRAARLALPFAVDFPQNMDHQIYYAAAIDAACNAAVMGGDTLKSEVSERLIPRGRPVSLDPIRVRLLPMFGRSSSEPGWADAYVIDAARAIRLQVQEVMDGTEPTPPGGVMMQSMQQLPGRGRFVYLIHGTADALPAAVVHAGSLSEVALATLFQACLELAGNEFNATPNRVALMSALEDLVSHLTTQQKHDMRSALLPLARGEGISASEKELYDDSQNPLNPFKMNLGDPQGLRGAALRCLVQVAGLKDEDIQDVMIDALVDPRPAVRKGAVVATCFASDLTEPVLWALLQALRDPISDVAATAFWSLVRKDALRLDPFQSGLLVTACQFAVQSEYADIRRAAAALVARSPRWLPAGDVSLTSRAEQVRQTFATDVSFAVRREAAVPPGEAE